MLSAECTLWLRGCVLAGLLLVGGEAHALPNTPDSISARGRAIRITPIFHASLQIEYRTAVIDIDPFSAGDYTGAKKADLILITDIHADHLDEKAIKNVIGKGCVLICPQAVADKLKTITGLPIEVLNNGGFKRGTYKGVAINITALPMYNLTRGPKPGEKFHTKGRGDGYVLEMGGKRIYIAGDTEVTPEMKALKNIDVAFVPMNLPFTMTPQEAAQGVKAFKPKVVYPYHYRYPFDKPNTNPQTFAAALKGTGITVKLRDWYAHPAKNAN